MVSPPYLFEFECLLAWRFLRCTVAMFSTQIRAEARRERFARKVVEAAFCVASHSHREDRKCSFEAPIMNIDALRGGVAPNHFELHVCGRGTF